MRMRTIPLKEVEKLEGIIHLSEAPPEIFEEVYPSLKLEIPQGEFKTIENTIFNWGEDPLITLYHFKDVTYWQPHIERSLVLEVIEVHNPSHYYYGYIDGVQHHEGSLYNPLGLVSSNRELGYLFFQEFN